MEQDKIANKINRLLAAYIDIVIFANLIKLTDLLVGFIQKETAHTMMSEITAILSIIFYLVIFLLYLLKDSISDCGSLGKQLLGLKIESTNGTENPTIFKRNVLGGLVLIAYSISSFTPHPQDGALILLAFIIFNAIFICCNANQKLGDIIAHLRVVEDQENKIWASTNKTEKQQYTTLVAGLILLIILSYVKTVTYFLTFRMQSPFSILVLISHTFISFCITYKLIKKFIDNRLLTIMLTAAAILSSLAMMANDLIPYLLLN